MRAMVATTALGGVLVAGIGVLAVTAATAQDAEPTPAQAGVSADVLVDRLVELERGLPALPPGSATTDPETSFGTVEGDFLGALTELEIISDEARQLFIDADEADGDVAEAVALVARGYLRLEQAYNYLSQYEDFDLARPVGTVDDSGVATGADTASGWVEAGLDIVDTARMDALLGYAVLRDSEAADDAEKELFDAAYRDSQNYLTVLRPDTNTLVSASSSAVLLAVYRFDAADTSEPRAKDATYVCIAREQYPLDSPDPVAALSALLDGTQVDLLPAGDCPDLPGPENTLSTRAG